MFIEIHNLSNKRVYFFNLDNVETFRIYTDSYSTTLALDIDNKIAISFENHEQLKALYKKLRDFRVRARDEDVLTDGQYLRILLCEDGNIESSVFDINDIVVQALV